MFEKNVEKLFDGGNKVGLKGIVWSENMKINFDEILCENKQLRKNVVKIDKV